jgi:hypothetical protein
MRQTINLIASNQTDPSIGAVPMKSNPSHSNLWGKLEETTRYIHCHCLDEHDWFVKVDDDSCVIMENLRCFVSNIPDDDDHLDKPLICGRRYSHPPLVDPPNEPRFFSDLLAENQGFRDRFPQLAMTLIPNRKKPKYLQELVQALDSSGLLVRLQNAHQRQQLISHSLNVGCQVSQRVLALLLLSSLSKSSFQSNDRLDVTPASPASGASSKQNNIHMLPRCALF